MIARRAVPASAALLIAATSAVVCAQGRMSQEQYLKLMNQGLDRVMSRLDEPEKHPVLFSANLFFAHGAAVKYFDLETLTKYADALKEAGARRIDLNPGVFPWLDGDKANIEKYDALVKHIRAAGLQIALNPEINRGEREIDSLADWEAESIKLYEELARRYQPDVFVLVHEPTTMATRAGVKATPKEWRRYVERTAAVVRKHSPKSRLAAGGLAQEREYIQEFLDIPDLDLTTVNIYNLQQLEATNQVIQLSHKAKRPVYIAETWRSPYWQPGLRRQTLEDLISKGIGNRDFQELDARWLEAMATYASVWDLEAFTPFWTQTFFLYTDDDLGALDWKYNSRVIEAVKSGRRTDTFRAYQRLAERFGAKR